MHKFIWSVPCLVVVSLSLTACMSNNVQQFRPDVTQAYQVKNKLSNKVVLGNFSMPSNVDKNHILCRLAGEIYLPNKMTYSSYIRNAFSETLILADRYAGERGAHRLSAKVRNVDFDSIAGTWTIAANVRVDRYPYVSINSKTKFGTSWVAWSACKNVAQGFRTAVQNFVNKTLSNPRIVRELNRKRG